MLREREVERKGERWWEKGEKEGRERKIEMVHEIREENEEKRDT